MLTAIHIAIMVLRFAVEEGSCTRIRSCLDYISMLDFLRIYNPSLHIGLSCVMYGMACLLRGSNLQEYIYIYSYIV